MTLPLDGQGSITLVGMLGRSHLLSASSKFPERDTSARVPVLSPLCHFTHCSPQRSLSQSASWCQKLGPLCIACSPSDLPSPRSQPPHRKLAFVMFLQSPAQPSTWEAFPDPKMTSTVLASVLPSCVAHICHFVTLSDLCLCPHSSAP